MLTSETDSSQSGQKLSQKKKRWKRFQFHGIEPVVLINPAYEGLKKTRRGGYRLGPSRRTTPSGFEAVLREKAQKRRKETAIDKKEKVFGPRTK